MEQNSIGRPIATVDLVVFGLAEQGLQVLLVRRGVDPLAGEWALPGGWIHVDEDADLEAVARRVLRAKAGIEAPYLEQLQTFGSARRDPRGWSVSVAYIALLSPADMRASASALAAEAAWRLADGEVTAMTLAFDHSEILRAALRRVRDKVEYSTLPVHLLPERFTLTDLQQVYERILGRRIDKSAFRKRIAEADFVEPIPGELRRASNRPAQLYRVRPGPPTTFFDRTI